jgi:uncharacterized protein involved in response to NO
MHIQISEVAKQPSFALFNLGFRPFFLLASLSAIVLMLIWAAMYTNTVQLNNYYGVVDWHSHELLFGYSVAVIAGFLLTAVRNWTGVDTLTGLTLALLAMLWLLARIIAFAPVNGWVVAVLDIIFYPFLIAAITYPIIKARQWHNLIMVFIISSLLLANILVHGQHLGYLSSGVSWGNTLALYTIVLLIQVITGRVMPFFTKMAIPGTEIKPKPNLERLLLIGLILLGLAELFKLSSILITALASILVVAHLIRISLWFSRPVLGIPILWVLYAGYCWLIVGFFLKVLVSIGIVTDNLAVHAWTVGVIGLITFGMMARVSLGHSGRAMVASKWLVVGFILLFLGAIIRVVLPVLFMSQYILWIKLSIWVWVIAFVLFFIIYLPILVLPRADGKPG